MCKAAQEVTLACAFSKTIAKDIYVDKCQLDLTNVSKLRSFNSLKSLLKYLTFNQGTISYNISFNTLADTPNLQERLK